MAVSTIAPALCVFMTAYDPPPAMSSVTAAATRQSFHVRASVRVRRAGSRRVGVRAAGALGNAPTTYATSTRGTPRANIAFASRSSWSSSRQSAQASTCASTLVRSPALKRSWTRSGSWSRISAFTQSFIEKLLHSPHRVVVMHSRRPFSGAHRFGDFLVRQAFRHSQSENFFLRWRQLPDRLLKPLLCFVRDHRIQRIVLCRRIVFLHFIPIPSSLLGAFPIDEQSTLNREQPRSERAVTAKAIERVECSNE